MTFPPSVHVSESVPQAVLGITTFSMLAASWVQLMITAKEVNWISSWLLLNYFSNLW